MFEQGLIQLLARGGVAMVVLLLFSIFSLAAIGERLYTYRRARLSSEDLAAQVFEYLRGGKLPEAILLCEMTPQSPVGQVLLAGLLELSEAAEANPGLRADRALEGAKGVMERATAAEIARLERYLGALATLGNVSPFVGLFGTVLGIIKAFEAIARTGSGGLGTVSAGIAEALVATAAGLFVAIPAVMAYNYFVGRVKAFATEMDNAASALIHQAYKLAEP